MTIDSREHEIRMRVVDAATGELGPGRVAEYWRDVLGPAWVGPPPPHWCGAFALWCLHQAGLALDVQWRVGRGFLMVGRRPLNATTSPQPGDIVYHTKFQHHAIVSHVLGDKVHTIDGNQGNINGFPVRTKRHIKGAPGVTYFSISRFVRDALAAAP